MSRDTVIEIQGEKFTLLPENAVFWHKEQALLFSDVHLGKAEVFQRSGIPVPIGSDDENILRLERLCSTFGVRTMYCLGDFIHSKAFWTSAISSRVSNFINHWGPNFVLIAGNHEMGTAKKFAAFGSRVEEDSIQIRNFVLSHEDPDGASGEAAGVGEAKGEGGAGMGGAVGAREAGMRGALGAREAGMRGAGGAEGHKGHSGMNASVGENASVGDKRHLGENPSAGDKRHLEGTNNTSRQTKLFVISGHVHPVVRIGSSADNITTRCFYLTKNSLLLPAFGEFTGGYKIKPKANDRVFAVLPDSVVEI